VRLPPVSRRKRFVQAGGDLLWSEQGHPRCCKLERQRYAVQALADLRQGGRILRVQRETRLDRGCAFEEELDGFGTSHRFDGKTLEAGKVSGGTR